MPRRERLDLSIPSHQKALYALGSAFTAYGVALLPPHGNGLIAVFVTAITLGILRPDIRGSFERHSEDLVELVTLGIFVVFGSLLTVHGLFGEGWPAVAIVVVTLLIARPVALAGTSTDGAVRAFMAWFGPKGVSTMTFSLLVLSAGVAEGKRIFDFAALVVFCSILAHGLTDSAGVDWIAQRSDQSRRGARASSSQ